MTSIDSSRPFRLLAQVQPIAQKYVQKGLVPGVIVAASQGDGPPEYLVLGSDAADRPLTVDTLAPVASVTKLATALAVLRLVDHGALELDAPLLRYLPDAAGAQQGATLRQALCHTAGLADDLEEGTAPYALGLDWPALARACLSAPPIARPGARVHYSNVGYGLLAVTVERQTGQIFREALQTLVLDPLGVEGYLGIEPPRPPAKVVVQRDAHTGTPLESFNSTFWRSLALPWGGLLTTVEGMLRLIHAFQGLPTGFLSSDLLSEARRSQTDDLPGGFPGLQQWEVCPWGLGPELRGGKSPHEAPAQASPESFGHGGSSGCIAWCDPALDIAWAISGLRQLGGTFDAISWFFQGLPAVARPIVFAARQRKQGTGVPSGLAP